MTESPTDLPLPMASRLDTSPAISVVIPTWKRLDALAVTLERLAACTPPPEEIVVHVDAGDDATAPWLHANHPEVRVIASTEQVGPGGGRNKLIQAARHPLIASFDDDSYPVDLDYFDRLREVFAAFPNAAVVSCTITHRNEEMGLARRDAAWTSSFVGCGCAYRRDEFLELDGYLDLPIAYGAEEADLAIQLQARGQRVLHSRWLRVFHDTLNQHHESPRINAAKIANIALLAYVRYPASMWPHAGLQVVNRVVYALRNRRFEGIVQGLAAIPGTVWRHRHLRRPVSRAALMRYLDARSLREPAVPAPVAER